MLMDDQEITLAQLTKDLKVVWVMLQLDMIDASLFDEVAEELFKFGWRRE